MNHSAGFETQFQPIISRITIFILLLCAMALGSPPARAQQTVTGNFTCDNAYAVWVGNDSNVNTMLLQGENTQAQDIRNGEAVTFTVDDDFHECYLYLIAWSDDRTYQGIIGSFTGTVQVDTGDPRWQVLHTNDDRDTTKNPNVISPYYPDAPTIPPSQLDINAKITDAAADTIVATNAGGSCVQGIWDNNSGAASGNPCWTAPYLGPENKTQSNQPSGYDWEPFDAFNVISSVSSDARWMWYDKRSGMSSNQHWPNGQHYIPFGDGFNHGEYLIFRIPCDAFFQINIDKQALNTPWQAGGTGTLQIAVTNNGDAIASGAAIVVSDANFPSPPLTVTSISGGSGWSCIPLTGPCMYTGPYPVGAGASLPPITVDVNIDSGYQGEPVQNCAQITLQQAGPPVLQGTSCTDIPIQVPSCDCCKSAKLNINKTHSPSSFTNGGTGTITITVANTGNSPVIAPIQVRDTLPAGLTMPPGPFSPAADIACLAGPQSPPPQQINCSYMGNSGGNFSFDLQVDVATDADQVVNNAAVIKGCCGERPNDTTRDIIPILNQEAGRICGRKFDDRHQPLSGWIITAIAAGTTTPVYSSSPSNADGEYCIDPLPQGAYTVNEQIPTVSNAVWIPVSPVSGSYSGVQVGSGTVNGIDFINKRNIIVIGGGLLPDVTVTKKHSPSTFSTGSKGAFTIKVKNKGKKLEKGMLTVVDHMPPGLSVKTGTFRAGSWNCKGGMVSSSGQDVTCTYKNKLRKGSSARLRLNVKVAPKNEFPAGAGEVENCATASTQGVAAGVAPAGARDCDKVKIRKTKAGSVLKNLAPLGGLIMQIPRGDGGGRDTKAPAGAAGP